MSTATTRRPSPAVLLLLHGIRARIAGDTAEALALARSFPPHAVVTTARLPDGDSCRLVAALRSEGLASSPLVIVTAGADDPEPPPPPTEGVYRLQRPIDPHHRST